jgi:hypothetical protein
MKNKDMKLKSAHQSEDMRAEYAFDYSKGVRGKYHRQLLREGSNVVVLDPDVAERFRTSAAVNEALRELLKASPARPRRAAALAGRARKKVRKPKR